MQEPVPIEQLKIFTSFQRVHLNVEQQHGKTRLLIQATETQIELFAKSILAIALFPIAHGVQEIVLSTGGDKQPLSVDGMEHKQPGSGILPFVEEALYQAQEVSNNQLLLELLAEDLEQLEDQDDKILRRSITLLKHISGSLESCGNEIKWQLAKVLKRMEKRHQK